MGPKCYAVQCTFNGETSKVAPSPWDYVTLLEDDRATAIDNMHKKFGKDHARGSGDILTDRHTHTHIDMLITILCNRSSGRSINEDVMGEVN